MGGATSGVQGMLENDMNELFLKNLMQENFDPIVFNTLKDENGNVSKDIFLSIMNKGVERELYMLFMGYAPTGKMDQDTYMRMCSNTKLLNKALTRTEAGDIFKKSLFRLNISGDEVTYYLFKEGVLPDFADERHVPVEDIFNKLARFDAPDSEELEEEYKALEVLKINEDPQHSAACKLQKMTRGKNARRKMKGKIQVRTEHTFGTKQNDNNILLLLCIAQTQITVKELLPQAKEKVALRKMNTGDEMEFLRGFFEGYCKPMHELSAKSFKRMCKDANMFNGKFLPVDCEIAFSQVLAQISILDSADPLHESVIFDKRIEFPVFFMFLLPEVAELKAVATDDVIAQLYMAKEKSSALGVSSS